MPTVLRIDAYRFFFYAGDGHEPVHVHVRRDRLEAKFWLGPVRLEKNRGFSDPELTRLGRLIAEHEPMLQDAWRDYFED